MTVVGSMFGSELWRLVILGAVFAAVFAVSVFLVGLREEGKRRRSLLRRLTRGGKREDAASKGPQLAQWIPTGLVQAGERFASAGGFNARLDEKLEQAGLPIRAGEFVALTVVCAMAGTMFAAILLPNIVFVLAVGVVGAFGPNVWMSRGRRKRQRAMEDQLGDTLAILASSLRAGHSFLQALDMVAKEIGDPSATEFQRVVAEIRLGRPVDDALWAMADRVNSDDLRWAVIAVNIQREVGGNLAEVLDIVANTVRERAYVRRQVRVLSAEGRFSIGILTALPFLIFAYIVMVNREYVDPLFSTTIGNILLGGGALLMLLGIFVMKRIVRIDV